MTKKFDQIVLREYNPEWNKLFMAEKVLLENHFKYHFLGIEHIGSTAVPGMLSKPIIDMLVGISEKTEYHALIPELNTIEYEFVHEEEDVFRMLFEKKITEDISAHLHMVIFRQREWKRHLAFRDYLRSHKDIAAIYQEIKKQLAEKYQFDRAAYTEHKSYFIRSVEKLCL